jgi:hypothetical protein
MMISRASERTIVEREKFVRMNPERDLVLAVARRDGDISAAITRVSNWDRAIDLLASTVCCR